MFKLQRLEITGFKSFADYTEIIFTGNGITAVVGPNGCGKCVSGDTLVTLSDGREIEIRQLVEAALRDAFFKERFDDGEMTRENPSQAEILSLNPQTLQLEVRPISAFVKRKTTSFLLRVQTKSGREIKTTPYHPLFTLENGILRELKAEEIRSGVKIAVPRQIQTTKTKNSLDFAALLHNFDVKDNVYISPSTILLDWTENGRAKFGTLEKWAESAGVPTLSLRSLRSGQAINAADLVRLGKLKNDFPPLENQIKSRGNGRCKLPSHFTPELARFLGLLIAEGRNTSSNQIWFVNSDKAINDEFERLSKQLFDLSVCRRNYKKGTTDSLIFSRSLCLTLERWFNFKVNSSPFEKEIPPQLFAADIETKWAFLSGLFEGDAYICSRKQKNNGKQLNYIEYTTASERLARQTVSLLLQCGVFALLRPRQKYATNTTRKQVKTYFSVFVYGAENLQLAAEKLKFVGSKQKALKRLKSITTSKNPNYDLVPSATTLVKEAAKLAGVKVKPNRKRCPKLAAYTSQMCEASRDGLREVVSQIQQLGQVTEATTETLEKLTALAESDVYWDEVVEVEKIAPPDEWVYDLSVDETHNFVAGNIIVHNSNISDSLTWVLGEQRAKNLRGGEMQDVIFAGTKTRQPSGMAEVVLHLVRDDSFFGADGTDEISDIDEALRNFDDKAVVSDEWSVVSEDSNGVYVETNGNGHYEREISEVAVADSLAPNKLKNKRQWKPRRAALDFAPGEAVTVTRRLYRSGDSEYQLNGRACRLRDIQDLFAGTGLSGGHYALVQQEKISQILSAKPAERRQLIEEAAGITKFRTRQRAAEVRLDSAKNNLRRISDIVSEVDKQANSLRRQAARTRRYREMQETLRELLAQVFAVEGLELSNILEALREELVNAMSEESRLVETIQKQAEAAQTATQAARQAEEKLAEVRQTASENALRRERLSRDLAHQTEQTSDLEERISALRHEIKTLTERLAGVSADAQRLREKNQQSNNSNEAETVALQSAEQNYQKHLAEVRQIEANLEKVRNELFQHTTAVERFREIGKQQANALERLTERAEGLGKEGMRAAATHDEKEAEAVELDEKIKTAQTVLAQRKAEKQTALETAQQSQEELQTLEKNLNKIRDEANSVRARGETLEKLDSQNALLAPAVQKLFAAQKQIGVELQGTLADFLRVEARYERAVEAVFGANLQTVLVETAEDVNKIAAWLKTAKAGTLNLLAGTFDTKSTNRGKSQKIADLLEISDGLRAILREVLPDALNFLLIEDLSEANKFTDQNCVTLSGEIVRQNRFFSFGQQGEKQSILSFKRELRELTTRADKLKAEFETTEQTVNSSRETLKAHEEAVANLNSAISFDEREVMSLEMEIKSLRQEVERAERHKKVVEDEKVRLQNELKDLIEKQIKAETDGKIAESARQNASAKLADVSASLADARKRAETANSAFSEKRAEAAAAGERRRSLQNALRRVEQEQAETKSRLGARNNDLEDNNKKLQQLKDSLVALKAQTVDVESEKEQEQFTINEATKVLTTAREQADKLATTLNEANAQAAKAKDVRAALEVNQAEIATRLQNLYDTCRHDLNQTLHEVLKTAQITDFDLTDGKRKVEDLRSKLEGFGAVNLLALEELNETEERLLFLTSQRRDIVDGIAAAEDALAEIKRRSRERFEHAFGEINRNFTELFSEIFGGGRGEMSLLDAADVLESGVEIVAQPPGKRLQNLLLLSGGEKALTAIALVLAIFRYRPAPFCLLDEVDAPLDEANVGRFIEKVAQMSEDIQFIVITHNKRTMEAARSLYGVTMEEAGISKLVSVKFE